MSRRRDPYRFIAAAAAVTPLVLLAGARFLSSAGPIPAPAATGQPEQAAAAPRVRPASAEQKKATEWLAAWTMPAPCPSPMLHAKPEPAAAPEAPIPASTPKPQMPEFTVRSIMGSGERGVASINGKAYRLGGEPAAGWKITRIDGPSKIVTLTGPAGQSMELSPAERKR